MTRIRLAPSGPEIANGDGGFFDPGPGARLRLSEAISPMGGSAAIPTEDEETNIISALGFATPPNAPISVTLDNPSPGLRYRAKLTLDVANESTNILGRVVLYLDTSVDGGATWDEQAIGGHEIGAAQTGSIAEPRQCEAWIPLTLGSDLGVVTSPAPSPSIMLRARALNHGGEGAPQLLVDALEDFPGGPSGLQGSIHLELEECF